MVYSLFSRFFSMSLLIFLCFSSRVSRIRLFSFCFSELLEAGRAIRTFHADAGVCSHTQHAGLGRTCNGGVYNCFRRHSCLSPISPMPGVSCSRTHTYLARSLSHRRVRSPRLASSTILFRSPESGPSSSTECLCRYKDYPLTINKDSLRMVCRGTGSVNALLKGAVEGTLARNTWYTMGHGTVVSAF